MSDSEIWFNLLRCFFFTCVWVIIFAEFRSHKATRLKWIQYMCFHEILIDSTCWVLGNENGRKINLSAIWIKEIHSSNRTAFDQIVKCGQIGITYGLFVYFGVTLLSVASYNLTESLFTPKEQCAGISVVIFIHRFEVYLMNQVIYGWILLSLSLFTLHRWRVSVRQSHLRSSLCEMLAELHVLPCPCQGGCHSQKPHLQRLYPIFMWTMWMWLNLSCSVACRHILGLTS